MLEDEVGESHSEPPAIAGGSVGVAVFPGETIESVYTPADIYCPKDRMPAEEALELLIGADGSPRAACSLPENAGKSELSLFNEARFGRDSLITSMILFPYRPQLLKSTILMLAQRQGVSSEEIEKSEEEPGKIMHEDRGIKNNGWKFPYYGSEDATPLYIQALALSCQAKGNEFLNETYNGKDGRTHTLKESLESAVKYLAKKLDTNPEGLLEFKRKNPKGLINQAWKDSGDSCFHKNGDSANYNQGIATVEIQAYAYDALIDAAALLPDQALKLRSLADRIKKVVLEKFWVEDERGGFFAEGTDRDEQGVLRPLAIRTSNMGHLLNSRILNGNEPETVRKKEAIIKALFSADMLNVSGIRTLSAREKRYRAGSYHNGSVWPWDAHNIAEGLIKHGYYGLAWNLYGRILNLVNTTKKYAEFARGDEGPEPRLNHRMIIVKKSSGEHNCIEQLPQENQAWTVASVIDIERKMKAVRKSWIEAIPLEAVAPEKRKLEQEILSEVKVREEKTPTAI